jgi:hypothetical protein
MSWSPCAEFGNGGAIPASCLSGPFLVSRFCCVPNSTDFVSNRPPPKKKAAGRRPFSSWMVFARSTPGGVGGECPRGVTSQAPIRRLDYLHSVPLVFR